MWKMKILGYLLFFIAGIIHSVFYGPLKIPAVVVCGLIYLGVIFTWWDEITGKHNIEGSEEK